MNKNETIFGIRAVIEAIQAGKQIDKVLVRIGIEGELVKELFMAIKEANIPVQRVPLEKINRVTRKNHQGVIAYISAVTYQKLEDLVPSFYEDGRLPCIVVLDGLTDVRNFGAIARTCECAGIDAIVIPEKGSVSVNADAVKTSAGALHHIPVCREKSVNSALKYLKDSGYKIIAATEKSSVNYTKVNDFLDPVAIVMGSEDTGISNENLRICDSLVSIPMFGEIGSLNVSVAAGVLIYECIRQRLDACEQA